MQNLCICGLDDKSLKQRMSSATAYFQPSRTRSKQKEKSNLILNIFRGSSIIDKKGPTFCSNLKVDFLDHPPNKVKDYLLPIL